MKDISLDDEYGEMSLLKKLDEKKINSYDVS